jgi:hypothetical protein
MKRLIFIFLVLVAAIGTTYAQSKSNRLNLTVQEKGYAFNDPAYGSGMTSELAVEWLPQKGNLFGTIASTERAAVGVYAASTINNRDYSWEDKRLKTDTAFSIADLSAQNGGIMAILNMNEVPGVGDLIVTFKTGPSFFKKTANNRMKYNYFLDSVLTRSEVKSFQDKTSGFGWDVYAKLIRFNRDDKWIFRNSLEIRYLALTNSESKQYADGTLWRKLINRNGYLSLIGESNIADLNLGNKIGIDPRIHFGLVKGADYYFGLGSDSEQIMIGASLSLVPRTDRENDVLNDAINIGCTYQSGRGFSSGSYFQVTVNLISLARLF